MKYFTVAIVSFALLPFESALCAIDSPNPPVETTVLDRIAPAKGVVKLGPANSANAWFAVREEGAKLVWTRTPFSGTSGIVEASGEVQHDGVSRWIPWSIDINDNGVGAITAGAYDSTGSVENGIVVVETATKEATFIRVGKFLPHRVKVDGKNRIWVLGTPMASVREEEPGDLPMIRVYSRQGVELARGFQRSNSGEEKAERAMNLAFTEIVGEDYLLQIRGHNEIHRVHMRENARSLEVSSIPGPEGLASPKAHLVAAIDCGSGLIVRWRTSAGAVSFLKYESAHWMPFEMVENGKPVAVPRLAGCTAKGEAMGISASGELVLMPIR